MKKILEKKNEILELVNLSPRVIFIKVPPNEAFTCIAQLMKLGLVGHVAGYFTMFSR